MSERTTAQLSDFLTAEQILQLYTSPLNGFGSKALDTQIRLLIGAWGNLAHVESGFTQRHFTPEIKQVFDDTSVAAEARGTMLIAQALDHHAIDRAQSLEVALLRMGLTQEQLAQLPRTATGHINDSFEIGEKSGIFTLMQEVYKPQLRQAFMERDFATPSRMRG